MRYLPFCLLALLSPLAFSQLPDNDIFLVELSWSESEDGRSLPKLGPARNITKQPGYENQAHFLPDGQILYTASRDGKQTDIFRFDPKSGNTTQVTATPESEFSPTLMMDGRHFSVVRVEADQTQRLWQFPLDGGEPRLILPEVTSVGYHTWLSPTQLALFIVGEPHRLVWVDVAKSQPKTLLNDVGRCFTLAPDKKSLYAVHKPEGKTWQILQLGLSDQKREVLAETVEGAEDYVWTPDGALLMARESRLYLLHPKRDKQWRQIADLADQGLKGITRLALDHKGRYLTLVSATKL